MKKKGFMLGILAMTLVFGMMVVGCSDDEETNYFDTLGLSNSTPSSTVLSTYGINESQFNQIKNAAGGTFRGWVDDDGMFKMCWENCNASGFNSVADVLKNIKGENFRDNIWASGNDYDVDFNTKKKSKGGIYQSAGSITVILW